MIRDNPKETQVIEIMLSDERLRTLGKIALAFITAFSISLLPYAWAHFRYMEAKLRNDPNLKQYEDVESFILHISIPIALVVFELLLQRYFGQIRESKQQKKIEILERKVEAEPEKARPAWDLARVKLEAYFDRNLKQVRAIFIVAMFVMVIGFGLIIWGVEISIFDSNRFKIAVVASGSGVIAEFVSLTFMAIYKATMGQANEFMAVLERINTVGMAVQILDSMERESPEIKDRTRGEMIKLLLAAPSHTKRAESQKPKVVP